MPGARLAISSFVKPINLVGVFALVVTARGRIFLQKLIVALVVR
jgi:hypothetical protein